MRVLITGINGMLAKSAAGVLLEAGYEVRGMTRGAVPGKPLWKKQVEISTGSIQNPDDLDKAMRGCHVVIHAAAKTGQFPTALKHYAGPNIHGTRCVIEACKRRKIQRLIFVSTANTFGRSTLAKPADESAPFNLDGISSGYIHSKYLAQQEVLHEVKNSGLPAVVVNPAFLIGAGSSESGSGSIVRKYAFKPIITCPPGSKNFIHVKDAAVGIKNAIHRGNIGECYILGHQNLSYAQFFRMVMSCTGYRNRLIPFPGVALTYIGKVVSWMQSVKPFHFPLNHVNARLLCSHLAYSPKKAVSELGLPQTPIQDAVNEILKEM